jgi:hypothetical protein
MDFELNRVLVIWIAIAVCLLQSAVFSGLNLAVFGISRLGLEAEAETGNQRARRVLALRRDAHFLLATILWGNVASNALLAILSNSMLTGLAAFLFSTIVITFIGEITPQAYFSRNALRMSSLLAPLLRGYQFLLYPVARPTAKILDLWIGPEGIDYFRERGLREVIQKHVDADETDVDHMEGIGALNFLALDDLTVSAEGEPLDPRSVIALPTRNGRPEFPGFSRVPSDPFLREVERSGRKWVVITDRSDEPQLVMDSDSFLRSALFTREPCNPYSHCHRPIVVKDSKELLGRVLPQLRVYPEHTADDVIDHDIILVWADRRRVITGADLLGNLMRGITRRVEDGAESS